MKHIRSAIALIILMAACGDAMAQKEIVFGSESHHSSSRGRHHKRGGDAKNAVTIGLLSFINGYTPLYYERVLTNSLTVQAGIGITTRSFTSIFGGLSGEGYNSENFNKAGEQDVADNYDDYKFRKATPGLCLSVAPKIYYAGDGMDGAYISPMVEFKQYRWNARKLDETAPIGSSYDENLPHSNAIQQESMRCLDLTLNFGGLYQADNHIVFSWSTGIGVRNAHSSRLDAGIRNDGFGNGQYANAVTEYDKTKLLFTFQFAIGGWY